MDSINITRGINYTKKLAALYYQDLIWQLSDSGMSVRSITNKINKHHIPYSRFKGIALSKSTIHNIIKKRKK